MRIEPSQWLDAVFARSLALTDVLRHPVHDHSVLGANERDQWRQSQLEQGEIVRTLGYHRQHALIMKSDHVVGWVERDLISVDQNLSAFEFPVSLRLTVREFFRRWSGTPYVWGGVTQAGIDCSGLSQRYFRDVLDRQIPRNSFDQRRSGKSKGLSDPVEHDLVFCTRIGGSGIHHVAICADGGIWHAHGELGVIFETCDAFTAKYRILEVVEMV